MLPREAESAVDLDVFGRSPAVRTAAVGSHNPRRDWQFVCPGGLTRSGIVRSRTRELHSLEHLDTAMRNRLEGSNRPPELLPLLGNADEHYMAIADRVGLGHARGTA